MAAGELVGTIKLDGLLDDPAWAAAPVNTSFKTIVPDEGGRTIGSYTSASVGEPALFDHRDPLF